MKTTYLIEHISSRNVVGYYHTLTDAKSYLECLPEKEYRVLVLKGKYYGEGRHIYQVIYFGNVFLKQSI